MSQQTTATRITLSLNGRRIMEITDSQPPDEDLVRTLKDALKFALIAPESHGAAVDDPAAPLDVERLSKALIASGALGDAQAASMIYAKAIAREYAATHAPKETDR